LLLIGEEELDELKRARDQREEEPFVEEVFVIAAPEISLNAMTGVYHPRTLRVSRSCKGKPMMILVYGGSTHNFIKSTFVKGLNLVATEIPAFQVMVGSGSSPECHVKYMEVPIQLQGHEFIAEFFELDMNGTDMVLGVHRLATLGNITLNYRDLTMKFERDQQMVELQGERALDTDPLSRAAFKKMVAAQGVACMYHLQVKIHNSANRNGPLERGDRELQQLLQKHGAVFAEPEGLPPQRSIDHRIHLEPGAKPVNVRPYRYPHYQKGEIERLVEEMLKVGIIKDSHSAFSRPVLLVRKKDDTWRFCVDYRALKAITVKDKFSISTIDEIMDDLNGAKYFSKLDFRFGYHQILKREMTSIKRLFAVTWVTTSL